jgi:choline monooxygenase
MSDLSLQLQQAHSQIPAQAYFDELLFQRERALLFASAPRYVGHALSTPRRGDYHALAQEGNGRALVHGEQGVKLISNVCRHRQATILRGRGSLLDQAPGSAGGNIVCPLHRWTYSDQGLLLGAPHFDRDPCLNLSQYPLQAWNGLLFEGPAGGAGQRHAASDLAGVAARSEFDFSGFVMDHVELHDCAYNWKTFIEVYLEDYHVGPFHPGLGSFVTCEDLRWEFHRHCSVQTVGVANRLGTPGSPVYERWHQALLRYRNGVPPRHGAIWLTYYPAVMVEWYPHVLTVSSLYPIGPQRTLNVIEFFYPEEIASFEREFVEAQRAAYMETCAEDDEIALRMDAGRRALAERGDDERGPYQSPMENGMQHFHEWYRQNMNGQADPG